MLRIFTGPILSTPPAEPKASASSTPHPHPPSHAVAALSQIPLSPSRSRPSPDTAAPAESAHPAASHPAPPRVAAPSAPLDTSSTASAPPPNPGTTREYPSVAAPLSPNTLPPLPACFPSARCHPDTPATAHDSDRLSTLRETTPSPQPDRSTSTANIPAQNSLPAPSDFLSPLPETP